MPGVCRACTNPQVREINHKLRDGRPLTDISRWLGELGTPITRQALARHAQTHLGQVPRTPGRKPFSSDLAEMVVGEVVEGIAEGRLTPTIGDGLKAQSIIEQRRARDADRDLMAKIALALTGNVPQLRVLTPEQEVLEAEFRPLLTSGAE